MVSLFFRLGFDLVSFCVSLVFLSASVLVLRQQLNFRGQVSVRDHPHYFGSSTVHRCSQLTGSHVVDLRRILPRKGIMEAGGSSESIENESGRRFPQI